jgi:predicted acetyltransferase
MKHSDVKIIKATHEQIPILANLLELYAYDFSEYWKFDIGDNGFYGYEDLPLFWTDPNRYPYLIYVKDKIAGLVMVQKGSPISDDKEIWDIAEFFIMKKYKKQGIGTAVAHHIWGQFKGRWQVRVIVENEIADAFWLQAITKFIGKTPDKTIRHITEETWSADWNIYTFESS